jgi:hypothetical protein
VSVAVVVFVGRGVAVPVGDTVAVVVFVPVGETVDVAVFVTVRVSPTMTVALVKIGVTCCPEVVADKVAVVVIGALGACGPRPAGAAAKTPSPGGGAGGGAPAP